MLLVQKYLENYTFGDLARDHGVYASFSKSGHKFSLNYDQIEAKESNPLAQECRGLVLAAEDGQPFLATMGSDGKSNRDGVCPGKTTILAYPMKRFFNYGQGSAAEIDWTDPELAVLEKLDGTLCIVYFDRFTNQWCVATRSVPEADLPMDNGIFTFRTLFEKAVKDTVGMSFDELTATLDKDVTYCFELCTPYNRIVVYYNLNRITLLAARNLVTLQEYDIEKMPSLHPFIPRVWRRLLPTNSVQELVDWVSEMNPMNNEGIVVRDSNFNRIKIKNAAYVAYNKARDTIGASQRNCLELVLSEKEDDVIPFLPEEIVKNVLRIKEGVQRIIKEHDEAYTTAKARADAEKPGDKKTFAILVTQNKKLWSAPFFQMFEGKVSNMKDYIKKSRDKTGNWGNSFLDKVLELIDI